MFYVGMKVVCVDPMLQPNEPPPYPVKGEVYTVANIIRLTADQENLELVELDSPETDGWFAGFDAACFRPAVDRPTDISIFRAMLNPSKQGADA
jgi:hypothetical protein